MLPVFFKKGREKMTQIICKSSEQTTVDYTVSLDDEEIYSGSNELYIEKEVPKGKHMVHVATLEREEDEPEHGGKVALRLTAKVAISIIFLPITLLVLLFVNFVKVNDFFLCKKRYEIETDENSVIVIGSKYGSFKKYNYTDMDIEGGRSVTLKDSTLILRHKETRAMKRTLAVIFCLNCLIAVVIGGLLALFGYLYTASFPAVIFGLNALYLAAIISALAIVLLALFFYLYRRRKCSVLLKRYQLVDAI